MNKKNYVYKICANGDIYEDLNSAIFGAMSDINFNAMYHLSKPLVSKISGGYQVIVVDSMGNIYRRRIDVFAPVKVNHAPKYRIDKVGNGYHNYNDIDNKQDNNNNNDNVK